MISTVSRLVVDINRPLRHPRLLSAITRAASPGVRAEIVARHYLPYRAEVESLVAVQGKSGRRPGVGSAAPPNDRGAARRAHPRLNARY